MGKRFHDHKGDSGMWEYTTSPKGNLAGILAFTENNQAVIIKQFRLPIENYILQLPFGFVDVKDDNPEEGVKRELLEETGYSVEKITELGDFSFNAGISDLRMYLFVGFGARKIQEPTHEFGEDIETMLLTKNELLSLVGKQEISTGVFAAWMLAEQIKELS